MKKKSNFLTTIKEKKPSKVQILSEKERQVTPPSFKFPFKVFQSFSFSLSQLKALLQSYTNTIPTSRLFNNNFSQLSYPFYTISLNKFG